MKLDLDNDIDRSRANSYMEKLMNQRAFVDLKKVNPKRSLDQNSYLHACFGLMSKHTGFTIEEMKTIAKRRFGSFMIYSKDDQKFCQSSAKLDTKQMTEWIDWLRLYSMDEVGVYLPTPEEYRTNVKQVMKEAGI